MKNQEYLSVLASCRYYKQEGRNPYDGETASFWDIERAWCQAILREDDETLSSTLDTYIHSNCYKHTRLLDIPVGLLSYLYAYYSKRDEMIHANGFIEFLSRYQREERERLMSVCHYLGKEYDTSNGDKRLCELAERFWLEESLRTTEGNNPFKELLIDYECADLNEFEKMDAVPLTLKATLFNRWRHHYELCYIDDFKKFYRECYGR